MIYLSKVQNVYSIPSMKEISIEMEVLILKSFISHGDILLFAKKVMNQEKSNMIDDYFKQMFKEHPECFSMSSEMKEGACESENEQDAFFIKERAIFTNHKDVRIDNSEESDITFTWYKTLNDEEIINAINRDRFYVCVVLNEQDAFDKYKYAISYQETEDDNSLFIKENTERNFKKEVIPKLEKIVGNILIK